MDVTWLHPKILQSERQNAVVNETDAQKNRRQTGILRWAPLSSVFHRCAKPHNESLDAVSPTRALVPAERNSLCTG